MELTLFGPGGDGSRRYTLANGETLIGRRPDCRIVLDAPSISARHARLFTVDGHAVIHGIDQTWPVYVNGEPVKSRVLAAGDDIELGPYRLRYTDGGNAAAVDPGPEAAHETATEPDPGPIGTGPPAAREQPGEPADEPAAAPAHSSPSGAEPVDTAMVAAEPAPIAAAPPETEPAAPPSIDAALETAETAGRERTDTERDMPDRADADADVDAASPDPFEPESEDTQITEPGPVEPAHALPDDTEPVDAGAAPAAGYGVESERDGDVPQQAAEPSGAAAFHLDILTGINRGRRIALTNDLVVLGFNQQRLVEIRNDDGALSLRRLDDDAAAELNGVPMTAKPREALADDVISLQRIEMRIHRERP